MAAKLQSISKMFVGASQNQEILLLQDRVEELEAELQELRSQKLDATSQAALEEQIQGLANQLGKQGGEHLVPLEQIQPDPDQPRTVFPEQLLQARAKSLQEEGQLNPIILIPQEGWYKIFDGEVRWRSAPLAGYTALKAVFLTQESLDKLDRAEIFDRQLTTSIQSEKLHPFDLANGLVRLMLLRHPELPPQNIPSGLNGFVQRLRRTGKVEQLEEIMVASTKQQQKWLEGVCTSEIEQWVVEVILAKQLNPVSINSNVFPLLNLPEDLQEAIRTAGLEGSKLLELKKINGKSLDLDEDEATQIRQDLTQEVIQERLALNVLRARIKELLADYQVEDTGKSSAQVLKDRFNALTKDIKSAKLWQDPQKSKKLEKLMVQMEQLLLN